jgi:hypothetical protein
MREAAYETLQSLWSAWLRRRLARDFAAVERFCLFVGYPRSGHSLVAALLNAHRDAVIAHELDVPPLILAGCRRDALYARIVARARWFHLRGDRSNYAYRVPGQWQGRFATLRVIGDKRGGATARCIAAVPDFLERVRGVVGVPLRVIHVVRNPFDNVAAIAQWHAMPLEEAVRYYFMHCEVTSRLGSLCGQDELLSLRHEELIDDPAGVLARLCAGLGLAPYPGYLDDCRALVFPRATYTRRKVAWPPALRREVEERAAAYPHLAGYAYDDDAPAGSRSEAAPRPDVGRRLARTEPTGA